MGSFRVILNSVQKFSIVFKATIRTKVRPEEVNFVGFSQA